MIKIHRRITLFWCGASQYYTLICTIDKTNTNNTNNSNNNEKHIGLHYSMCIHNTAQPLYQLPSKMGNTHSHTHLLSLSFCLWRTRARAFKLSFAYGFFLPIGANRSIGWSVVCSHSKNKRKIYSNDESIYTFHVHTHTHKTQIPCECFILHKIIFIYLCFLLLAVRGVCMCYSFTETYFVMCRVATYKHAYIYLLLPAYLAYFSYFALSSSSPPPPTNYTRFSGHFHIMCVLLLSYEFYFYFYHLLCVCVFFAFDFTFLFSASIVYSIDVSKNT